VPRTGRDEHGPMAFDVERLLRLWSEPLGQDDAAAAAFREIYADPVSVNGAPVSAAGLVARAPQGRCLRPGGFWTSGSSTC
jgi:hypothetical protein